MIHRRSDTAKYFTLLKHDKHIFTPLGTGFVWDCTSRIQQNVSSQSKDGHCSERYSLHAAKSFSVRWQFLRQSKKYPHSFRNVEGSWSILQEPATGPYLEPLNLVYALSFFKILILSPHLRLGFPNSLFPSDFPNKTKYKQTNYVISFCDFTLSHIIPHLFGVWHYIIISQLFKVLILSHHLH